jgi:acyl carrier protein
MSNTSVGTAGLERKVGLDSMDLTTVVLILQDEFKVVIPEQEYPNLTTVRAIAAFIQQRLDSSEKAGTPGKASG